MSVVARKTPDVGGATRVTLEVLGGPRAGQRFTLDGREPKIVGRSRLVDCPLPEDNSLSRDHFVLEVSDAGMLELRDLGSTNGTFVNDHQVRDLPWPMAT